MHWRCAHTQLFIKLPVSVNSPCSPCCHRQSPATCLLPARNPGEHSRAQRGRGAERIPAGNFEKPPLVLPRTAVFGKLTSFSVGQPAGNGHSPGTDRERQATQEDRHSFPPPNEQFNLQTLQSGRLLKREKFRRTILGRESATALPLLVFPTRQSHGLRRDMKESFSYSRIVFCR